MYEFPKSVQEWTYNVCEFGESHEIQRLFNLKKQENVCSEEFIYLLCDACITFGKEAEAEALLKELENSSSAGRTAADKLRDLLQGRYDVVDDELDNKFGENNDCWKQAFELLMEIVLEERKPKPGLVNQNGRFPPCVPGQTMTNFGILLRRLLTGGNANSP